MAFLEMEGLEKKLSSSFQIRRNMFELLKDIIDKKPAENQSLYEFYFDQKCKIDRFSLEFSEQDIISIIIGNIGDSSIGASIEASNFVTCDSLASFLHGRTYKSKIPKQMGTNVRDNPNRTISHIPATQVASSTSSSSPAASVSGQQVPINKQDSIQIQNRRQIKCYLCGGNHKRNQCESNKCDYCGKRGHLEAVCYHKQSALKSEKQETKTVSVADSRNKFIKAVCIKDFHHEALIDTGSSCSLMSDSLARSKSLNYIELPSPVLFYKDFQSKT